MEDARKKEDALFKKQLKKAGLWFLIGTGSMFAAGLLPPFLLKIGCHKSFATFVNLVLRGLYVFGILAAVFKFTRTLHDPLSERERKELEEKDTLEKTGK